MNYTKGEWRPTEFSIYVDNKRIFDSVIVNDTNKIDSVSIIELEGNIELTCSAVNACIKINPNNPQAVAESIEDMYEALKYCRTVLVAYQAYITGKYAIEEIDKALAKASIK
jgi:hypothetical protein